MASSEKRLTRQQIAEAMRKACEHEPCYPVQNGSYGACAICPNRNKLRSKAEHCKERYATQR